MGVLNRTRPPRPTVAALLQGKAVESAPSKRLVDSPQPSPIRSRAAPTRGVVELDEMDVVEGMDPLLVATPRCGGCPHHGHGWWWEHRGTGELHCVACWPTPPPRPLVKAIWESCPPEAAVTRLGDGDSVFVTGPDAPWPWKTPEPADDGWD